MCDIFTLAFAEISWTPLFAASLMIGVMRPLSVATAIEMWIESSARGPSPDQVTFTSGISYDKKSEVSPGYDKYQQEKIRSQRQTYIYIYSKGKHLCQTCGL